MYLLIRAFYGVVGILFLSSIIYIYKNVELKKTKKYNWVLLVVTFLGIIGTAYFSIKGTLNIRNLYIEMQSYTGVKVWKKYVVQQSIVTERNLIIRYNIICLLIFISHFQHMRLLKLNYKKNIDGKVIG